MKKNILAIYCIIGIVVGYLLRYIVSGIDENTLLVYGLIGGLAVGYLMDSRRKSSSTDTSSSKPENSFNIPSIKDITDKVEDVVSVGDEILTKVVEIDAQGRINLSRKDVLEAANTEKKDN